MTISTRKDGNTLIAELEGRLDTLTAPQLELELENETAPKLIIDMEKLEYISSAGLRVLLKLHKKQAEAGELIIQKPNEMVREVFEVTGFSEILNIEE